MKDESVTVQLNVCVAVPPLPSSTVTVTAYGSVWIASSAGTPEMTPRSGSRVSPSGRFVALYVRKSSSESLADSWTDTWVPATVVWSATGASVGTPLTAGWIVQLKVWLVLV